MTTSTAVARRAPQIHTAVTHANTPETSFQELLEMGQRLVGTGFMPEHIRNGAQAAAIILAGRELGMQPMRALRSIVLVKGRITEYADSQLARFKTDGGKAKFTTLDETRAVLWLRHPNGDEHTETFTLDDAKKAGLAGVGGMYQKYPKAMLRSRAITAGLKSVGWEGGAGVYDPAELASEPATEQIDDAEVVEDAPEQRDANAPSAKQVELLGKLLRSHVFGDEERAKITRKASTKEKMTAAIDYVQNQILERKAAEKAAAEPASDDDNDVEIMEHDTDAA
jgi:hypothetical protein